MFFPFPQLLKLVSSSDLTNREDADDRCVIEEKRREDKRREEKE
jgi:hypothetical protein